MLLQAVTKPGFISYFLWMLISNSFYKVTSNFVRCKLKFLQLYRMQITYTLKSKMCSISICSQNLFLQVKVGSGLKIEGVLGCCANGHVKNASVSDTEIGIAGTCQWKFCSINPRATVAVLLEIAAQVIPSLDCKSTKDDVKALFFRFSTILAIGMLCTRL